MRRMLGKLRPKPRTSAPADFFIELQDPHRTYGPGDVVAGSVVVVTLKTERVARIDLSLQGIVQVRNNLVKGKSVRHVLFEGAVTLWGGEDNDLEPTESRRSNGASVGGSGTRRGSRASTALSDESIGASSTSAGTGTGMAPTNENASTDTDLSANGSTDRGSNGGSNGAFSGHFNGQSTANGRPQPSRTSSSAGRNGPESSNASVSSINTLNGAHTMLPRGEHNFAFELELPKRGLFSSLEFERGSISYVLRASYHRAGSSNGSSTSNSTSGSTTTGTNAATSFGTTSITTTNGNSNGAGVGNGNVLISEKALSVVCPLDVGVLPAPKPARLTVEVRKKKRQRGSIAVSMDMPRKGYLKGEMIPVRIAVQHLKPVKSMTGVIVTLSRISRVSGSGFEAQSFRKDLSQTISPLYTDPSTHACIVSTNIRIPADTFPTISGHQVLSFQYCIEAVLDLAGKWNLQASELADHGALHAGFVDTDKLKVARGVVSLWSEVVIGTSRSGGDGIGSGALAGSSSRSVGSASDVAVPQSVAVHPIAAGPGTGPGAHVSGVPPSAVSLASQLPRTSPQSTGSSVSNYHVRYEDSTTPSQDDKARMRQLEEALLPSAPPEAAPVYTPSVAGPSSAPGAPPPPVVTVPPPVDGPDAPPAPTYAAQDALAFASAPEYPVDSVPYTSAGPSSGVPRDKLEAERERLEQMASMPQAEAAPEVPPTDLAGDSGPSVPGPSAPPLPASASPAIGGSLVDEDPPSAPPAVSPAPQSAAPDDDDDDLYTPTAPQ